MRWRVEFGACSTRVDSIAEGLDWVREMVELVSEDKVQIDFAVWFHQL